MLTFILWGIAGMVITCLFLGLSALAMGVRSDCQDDL
jgi:hypothetical protein